MKAKCIKKFEICWLDDNGDYDFNDPAGYYIEKDSIWSVYGDPDKEDLISIEQVGKGNTIPGGSFFHERFEMIEEVLNDAIH